MELFTVYNDDAHKYPVVVSVPHSGRYIPPDIRNRFIKGAVLTNMDWFLDVFYGFLDEMGVTAITANYSRYVIDLNRGLNLRGKEGDYKNTLVYTETTFGKQLYEHPINGDEISSRIAKYYKPYYETIENLVRQKISAFGGCYFLDMHSFFEQADEDICLSNGDNITCSSKTLCAMEDALIEQGFTVDKNNVFKGGRLIRHVKEQFVDKAECAAIEISYEVYLENRYFDEEEVTDWDQERMRDCGYRMRKALKNMFDVFMQL